MAESSDPQHRGRDTDALSSASNSSSFPSQFQAPRDGPKPIERLLSEDRASRIIPDTDSGTVIAYCSDFVRDFLRSDYLFCTSKMSVAASGKILALDTRFRNANAWMDERLAWSRKLTKWSMSVRYDKREVVVTHSLGGRLIRLLNQHDQLFTNVLGAYMAHSIDDAEKDDALIKAARHIRAIHRLCIPDNDRFTRDGKPLDADH